MEESYLSILEEEKTNKNEVSDIISSTSIEPWAEIQEEPPDCVDDLFPLVDKDLIEINIDEKPEAKSFVDETHAVEKRY